MNEKTEDYYLKEFKRVEKTLPGSGLSWLGKVRQTGIACFEKAGFPTVQQEEWRFTDISEVVQTKYGVMKEPIQADQKDIEPFVLSETCARLVFVNGAYAPSLSSVNKTEGIRVGNLADILSSSPESVSPFLARHALEENHAFIGLNNAFLNDGACVFLSKDIRLSAPIQILFLSKGNGIPFVSYPRVLVVAESHSEAQIVETYAGTGNHYLSNAVTEIVLQENVNLSYCRVQCESEKAAHMSRVQALIGRNSRFVCHHFSFGGRLVRNEVKAVLGEEGSESVFNGLSVCAGGQLVDNHTSIRHAKPHGTSRELYKGVWDGKSRGVFNGEVIVDPDAQKTDSAQTNKNLLLSRDALVHTKPELRILANDVKCKHGATIGQIDRDMLFYLRSRGMDEQAARRMLTQAFANEMVDLVENNVVRDKINEWIRGLNVKYQ